MTTDDPGHVNNLDRNQRDLLKAYWLALIAAIDEDSTKVIDSKFGEELFYLFAQFNPDVTLLRWLRACKWQVTPAVQFMKDTLKWRHEWGLRTLSAKGESNVMLEECTSGKAYYMGKDKANRPVSYVHASEHIRGQFPIEATEKFLILFMETGRDLAESHIEEGTVVLDMGNVSLKNLDYQYIKFMIDAMQNYYPECLGVALIVNAPWSFSTVWKIIRRWLDPVVESKIHFLNDSSELVKYIDPAVIPQRLQGNHVDFKFVPSTKEDEARLTAIRKDEEGMQKAQMEHRKAAQDYLNVTLKWANTSAQNEKDYETDRTQAAKLLSDIYRQLLPYISTQTYYHRIGMIQEPMFDITYNRICNDDTELTRF
ncbi:unnamed protein product [Adineta steineri]|uniref:CRAL-TRIO domain-containing protein n=1 Tax=Adineta steineri TaxID=433720 RepID=A0A818W5C7_9BILA|nr:unnamed protein product [Adineta steineri]CAF3720000.1 unnamed protein product [Adineta steineri]